MFAPGSRQRSNSEDTETAQTARRILTPPRGLGNDPTARILKPLTITGTGDGICGLGNDPTARILKLFKAFYEDRMRKGLGNDPTARILKLFYLRRRRISSRGSRQRSNSEDTETQSGSWSLRPHAGLGNDPTARILKLHDIAIHNTGWFGLGNDPTARILKQQNISLRTGRRCNGLGNDPTARILKRAGFGVRLA